MRLFYLIQQRILSAFTYVGGAARLLGEAIYYGVRPPYQLNLILQEVESIGIRSLTVVNVIALFTGMVLALQTAYALGRFGAKGFIGVVVAISLVREIGPVFTGIMVGGRVGSGIAAEIGSMKVTEQIDAIRVMGSNPVKRLVVPKLIAAVVSLPLLTIVADILGIVGGLLISVMEIKVNAYYYFTSILENLSLHDVASGIGKTFFFGLIIAVIGCYQGMITKGGTVGVGRSTTNTVVVVSILILVTDFFLTKLFLIL
ncbi:MAG: ABC transporter permease [Deltaproteobacteria bacterium]|nr:ABC transporter permease [Deltaproteobacteria bacterium]